MEIEKKKLQQPHEKDREQTNKQGLLKDIKSNSKAVFNFAKETY